MMTDLARPVPGPSTASGDRELDTAFWRHRPVAVTGATGFLGSHLTGLLVGAQAEVVILVRDDVPSSSIGAAWHGLVSEVRGRVEDQPLLERLLGEYGVQTVFHLAAQTQVEVANRNPVSTFETNITGTWAVLEAARRSPAVTEVVCASSDKAYGDQPTLPYDEAMPLRALNPYDVSKACADLVAASYHHTWDVPVCVTRCGNFFGPGDRNWARLVPGTIRALLEGRRPLIRSDGTLVRDYLYVLDGALANLQLAEALAKDQSLAGEAWNFSTERPLSVLELVESLQLAAGTELEPDVRATASHEISAQHLSAEKARTRLAWRPRYTLEQAVSETVEWYRHELSGVNR
jgi:CDP-glucose 4,6-dehydratase